MFAEKTTLRGKEKGEEEGDDFQKLKGERKKIRERERERERERGKEKRERKREREREKKERKREKEADFSLSQKFPFVGKFIRCDSESATKKEMGIMCELAS